MKNNNAIVIIWQGNEPSEYVIDKIKELIQTVGLCEEQDLTIAVKDENSVINAILRDTVNKHCKVVNSAVYNIGDHEIYFAKKNDEKQKAIASAVVFIGERFEASLTDSNTLQGVVSFAMNLTAAVTSSKAVLYKSDNDTSLLNAVEIIATSDGVIPQPLARKYHFNQKVVNVIKEVYQKTKC